jgi:hypothetical protein
MEPRRLTDGALANASNAWGTAAVEATGGSLSGNGGTAAATANRLWPNSPNAMTAGASSGISIGASSAEGLGWPGGLSTAPSGTSSRPTTGATGRGGMAAGGDSALSSPSGNAAGLCAAPPGWARGACELQAAQLTG